jgi:hypothetical protein
MNAEGGLVTALTSGIDCAAPAHNLELASEKAANVINLLRLRDVLETLTDFSNIKILPEGRQGDCRPPKSTRPCG